MSMGTWIWIVVIALLFIGCARSRGANELVNLPKDIIDQNVKDIGGLFGKVQTTTTSIINQTNVTNVTNTTQ